MTGARSHSFGTRVEGAILSACERTGETLGKKLAHKLGLERARSRKSEKMSYITEKEEIFTSDP